MIGPGEVMVALIVIGLPVILLMLIAMVMWIVYKLQPS